MLQIINPINPQWGWALISIKMLLANYLKKLVIGIFVIHIFTSENIFKCNVCGAEFTLKSSLQRHVKKYHLEGNNQCIFCDKFFTSEHKLSQHQKMHSGYPCEKCGKSFFKSEGLRNHKRRNCKL